MPSSLIAKRDKSELSRDKSQAGQRDGTNHPPLGGSGSCPGPGMSRPLEPAQPRDLARRVRRLAPSHRDPEAYHVEKSEIVAGLLSLARRMEGRRG